MNKRWFILGLLFAAVPVYSSSGKDKVKITLLVGESDSYKVSRGISDAAGIPAVDEKYDFHLYTIRDIKEGKVTRGVVARSGILLIDTMYSEVTGYALKNADFKTTGVYSVRERGNEMTTEADKIIFDPRLKEYYLTPGRENVKNLLLFLLNREYGVDVSFGKPLTLPEEFFFHPRAGKVFNTFDEYLDWYKKRGHYKKRGFWVGVADYSSYADPQNTDKVVSMLISSLEKNNINVLAGAAHPSRPEDLFFDESGKSRVDIICGLCFKMSATATEETGRKFMKLGVPVLNPGRVQSTISEWRESPLGLSPSEISWQICVPEFNGLIEPSVLGGRVMLEDKRTGKAVYDTAPIKEHVEFFVKRIKAWMNLRTKQNKDKKIAIIYWNHPPGKQNVGASYLNVFRSIEGILKRMSEEGYNTGKSFPTEEEIKTLVLKSGCNTCSFVPGGIEDLLRSGGVIRWPLQDYLKFYNGLNPEYRKKVEEQWGKPGESGIMFRDGEFVMPCITMGNVILMPQPTRGWGEDHVKNYHSSAVWPHHQYTAFYLWLKNEFSADAIISLGKHGTHEWLPGKQAGLSQSCPPEVLIQDLPNIYPYIVDNVGEGIQAKRRGRGVIIDHLIPVLKEAGAYHEYRELAVLIDEYNDTVPRSKELAEQKFNRIKVLVKKLGLDKDLLLKEINEKSVEKIEHYLLELQEINVPYGLHTYGVSPRGEALTQFSRLIKERNEDIPLNEIKEKLALCHLEMDRLIAAMEGRYVPAGEGNDPLRNPDAIPTGRNFYGFDPAKIPSKDAYALGKKQAKEIIRKYLEENGKYPDKIGLILWATEIHRNEGAQPGTALYLLGMKPVWDKNNRVVGTEPIPGKLLGRPRIDVHLQVSGLFRDSFPNVILLLDEAVRQAARMKDVENFIARHSRKIKTYLTEKGYSGETAEELSHTRIFSEEPGTYRTKLQELVPDSGIWKNDEEIADVFIRNVSFAYGRDHWGVPLESVYKKGIEDVKVTMHTLSSNLYGVMDNDDVFAYLGGLSLAVKRVAGGYPDVVISEQKGAGAGRIEDVERAIGKEMAARYLNPRWIEGMMKEDYAGAREMFKFLEYMWGWQVTTPFAVNESMWERVYEVYVEDKYGLGIGEFFDKANPWALQSMKARMLEAIRRDYWDAPDKVKKRLAMEYVAGVIEKVVACYGQLCSNPDLNRMVSGLLSPEMAKQFRAVVSAERNIEGYEMVEERKEETKPLSSGAEWAVIIIVFIFIGLLVAGWLQREWVEWREYRG